MINFEGGAIADEYQVEYVIDRVEATSTAFMGLTMGCARCHSHKFDPITHKEFYQFFAFFNNVPELGLDGRRGNAVPMILLTTPAQQKMLDDLDDAIEEHEKALSDEAVAPAQRAWEESVIARLPAQGSGSAKDIDHDGLTAHYELDGSFSDVSGKFLHDHHERRAALEHHLGFEISGIHRLEIGDDRVVRVFLVERLDRVQAFAEDERRADLEPVDAGLYGNLGRRQRVGHRLQVE